MCAGTRPFIVNSIIFGFTRLAGSQQRGRGRQNIEEDNNISSSKDGSFY